MSKRLPPMHPGEVLRKEFFLPLKLSAGALARKMDVPRTRLNASPRRKPASPLTLRHHAAVVAQPAN